MSRAVPTGGHTLQPTPARIVHRLIGRLGHSKVSGSGGPTTGRCWAIAMPAALGLPVAFVYLLAQDYTWIVVGFALQGMFACGGLWSGMPAYLSERFPTEVRATHWFTA
jgi:MFS family permease